MIFGAIKNYILEYEDFQFTVALTVHIINKRPVAFKDALRTDYEDEDNLPEPITPEKLIHGYELPSLNIIPDLQGSDDDTDPDWTPSQIKNTFSKLQKVRSNLLEIYQKEYFATLIAQASDKKDRYIPKSSFPLEKGDIVLIKETNMKPYHFPLGIVKDLTKNSLGEVTDAKIKKGRTGEVVHRHVTGLIPLLSRKSDEIPLNPCSNNKIDQSPKKAPRRRAAQESQEKTRQILNAGDS